ncbi:50S ribosomal protein L28 [bacterium]|nr:50S ribosomal protein L28 [bacterium]
MSKVCELCGKGPTTGNLVSHSNRHTRRRWLPNLMKVSFMVKGAPKSVKVCTRCMRSLKRSMSAE